MERINFNHSIMKVEDFKYMLMKYYSNEQKGAEVLKGMKTAGKLYHSGNVCLCKSYDNRNMDMDQV
jgi:hypothetical protein